MTLLAAVSAAAEVETQFVSLPPTFDMAVIVMGGLSGAAHAARMRLDPIGVFTVALCTAVGGGAIRDTLLDRGPPVFLVGTNYLAYAVLAAVVGYLFAGLITRVQRAMDLVDVLLLGLWVVIGAQKALVLGLSGPAAVFLGLVTATGGGLLRDLLARRTPRVFTPGEFNALAAFVASVVFVGLALAGVPLEARIVVTIISASALRAASLRWHWQTQPAGGLGVPVARAPDPAGD